MRLPASNLQHCYPMQAEGGFTGDIHKSVYAALKAWEEKRGANKGFRYGHNNSSFKKKEATATRTEISWNSAPEIKRAPCPRKKAERTHAQREARNRAMKNWRANETSEARALRLAKRNAAYREKVGPKPVRPKMTPEERKASLKEGKKRYRERVKAGLIPLEKPKSKLTCEQLAEKAKRSRRYYQQNKQKHEHTKRHY